MAEHKKGPRPGEDGGEGNEGNSSNIPYYAGLRKGDRQNLNALTTAGRRGLDLVRDTDGRLWAVPSIIASTGERLTHRSVSSQIAYGFGLPVAKRWTTGKLSKRELFAVLSWILSVFGYAHARRSPRDIVLERVGRT